MSRSRKGKGTRRTTAPINVWCLPAEREELERLAKTAGLSMSAYLREVGTGNQPRSVVDYDQVATMARANADLNQLGGLLKMWLTNEERLTPEQVTQLIRDIADGKEVLMRAAKKIIRSKR